MQTRFLEVNDIKTSWQWKTTKEFSQVTTRSKLDTSCSTENKIYDFVPRARKMREIVIFCRRKGL